MRIGVNAFLAETLVFAVLVGIAVSQNPDQSPLQQVADVPLPGAAVRFAYQSLDASHGRLYIAHMNANQLVVFDAKKREVVANLDGFPSVHGVWAVPELGRVYASATGEHQLALVDMKTLKTIARVGPINYPDGIAYAPSAKRLFVSDEHGDADAVIDATTNQLVATIPLGGSAGNTVYDPARAASWLRFTRRTNWWQSIPQLRKSSGDIHCPASRVRTAPPLISRTASPSLPERKTTAGSRRSHHHEGAVGSRRGRGPRRSRLRSWTEATLRLSRIRKHHRISRERKISTLAGKLFLPHGQTVSADPGTHLVYFPLQDLDRHPVLRIMVPVR